MMDLERKISEGCPLPYCLETPRALRKVLETGEVPDPPHLSGGERYLRNSPRVQELLDSIQRSSFSAAKAASEG